MSHESGSVDESRSIDEAESIDEGEGPDIDEGRYVYCLVRTEDEEATGEFETTGVEDEPVHVVTTDGVGAVVHECDDVYDSADFGEIRRWLVRHQSVVDDAGERFGTPLPFQFDTIIRGDDEAVRDWLRSERDTLQNALDSLADHWEYRVEVVQTDPVDVEALASGDDRLAELREKIDRSESGTAYLLEKRYEDRVKSLRDGRRDALTADVRERLSRTAREVHELESSPATTLGDDDSGSPDDGETVCRLTILAHEDDESSVGEELDEVAAKSGIEVRFTGPWPPYTFAPEFGDGESNADHASNAERAG